MAYPPPEFPLLSERGHPTRRISKHPPPRNCYHSSACACMEAKVFDYYEVHGENMIHGNGVFVVRVN